MYSLREFLRLWTAVLLGHLYYDYKDCLWSNQGHNKHKWAAVLDRIHYDLPLAPGTEKFSRGNTLWEESKNTSNNQESYFTGRGVSFFTVFYLLIMIKKKYKNFVNYIVW